jgi:two-component system chemotaxis sensor kinase CheA
MFQDDELVQEFVVESAAHLAQVEGQILEIESAGENYDTNVVNTVFRAVHSVKGAAGFLSLTVINSLAHSLENVLNMIRNRELALNKSIVNTLLRSADQLRILVDNVETSNDVDVSELVTQLDAIYSRESESEEAIGDLEDHLDHSLQQAEESVAAMGASEIYQPLAETHPSQVEMVYEFDHESTSSVPEVVAEEVTPPYDPPQPTKLPKTMEKPTVKNVDSAPVNGKNKATDSIVRVNVAVLDRLMNLAGELVLSRNQLILAVSNGTREGLGGNRVPC